MDVAISTTIKRKSKEGKETEYTTDVRYTPDILRLEAAGPSVEEWKNEEKLLTLAAKYPSRFYKSESDGKWHCPEREKFFSEMGITFRLRSSAEHNPIFTSNLDFLRDYFVAGSPLTDDAWNAIKRIVDKVGAISLAALNEKAFDDETPWNDDQVMPTPKGRFLVDDVLQAIVERRLWVDLDYEDLSDAHEVIVCASREQLERVVWLRPPPHAATEDFIFNVDVGSKFTFRGHPEVYTVAAIPAGKVLFHDASSVVFEDLSENQFETLLLNNDIQLLSTPKTIDELLAQCEYVSDKRIRDAHNKFRLLKALASGQNVPLSCDLRTIQRWKQKLREAGDSEPMQVHALISKRPGGRGQQIADELLQLIKEQAKRDNTPRNPPGSSSFSSFKKLCREKGLKPCSRNTFYRRFAEFHDILARKGARCANNAEPQIWYLHREDKIHGGRPFQRVHIDHTQLDIIIRIRGWGGRTYKIRPWITIVMDATTRAVLAFYLSAHTPSTTSCMMAIRAMVAIHKRVPEYIVVDNGKEFHARAFDQLCDLNDITLEYRPAHESRFGSVCERLFGTTNTVFIRDLVGNTAAMHNVRMITRQVNPLFADHLSFVELHGRLEHFFFVEYNRERRHPAHDHTPEEYMNKRFIETGRRLRRIRPYNEQFMIETCVPASRGGVREVDPQRGILIDRLHYWADEFAGRRFREKEVEVRIDMWDVSIAYARVGNHWVKCVSKLLARYRRLTAIELRYALYEVRWRLRKAPEECFPQLLDEVLSDHDLPAVADATAATSRIYGAYGLGAIADRLSASETSDRDDPDSRSPETESPSDSGANSSARQAQKTAEKLVLNDSLLRRFDVDYDSLPTQRPL
ncbi:DDE-type integrase/transposase/recombinase [Caballeronia sp. J97]|uniref:DDE-type integrase/transposase/recombinase n=1 Tax=Caballeronia sp. J97 TaxID=2805429 RepID=UPI002AB08F1F|nr:DDE-type integrase/transposase/recombinase [Caballeronia sp. J97]